MPGPEAKRLGTTVTRPFRNGTLAEAHAIDRGENHTRTELHTHWM